MADKKTCLACIAEECGVPIALPIAHSCGREGKAGQPYTDESPMPFGPFKGRKLGEVPASHLLECWAQPWLRGPIREYIKANFKSLQEKQSNE